MLKGETIASGADEVCPDCKVRLKLEVLRSFAGWYIGSQCDCGPYSRESDYFSNEDQAKSQFETGGWVPRM